MDPEFAAVWEETDAAFEAGTAIVQARTRLGLTQAQFAERAGVSGRYIARIENGDANPTVKALGRLLSAHGLRLKMAIEDSRVIAAARRSARKSG